MRLQGSKDVLILAGPMQACLGLATDLVDEGKAWEIFSRAQRIMTYIYIYKFRAINTNACIPAVFQQVCLILANNFSTSLWLSTALRCISVAHLQPKIECHVFDQSAVSV